MLRNIRYRLTIAILLLSVGTINAQNEHLPAFHQGDEIIRHTAYTLCYSEKDEQPLWVAYRLTSQMIQGTAKRKNNFRSDPLVSEKSAQLSDFRKSGYDRGHLAPAADMKLNEHLMSESFYMSNMSPQLPGFNRGIWKHLEAWIRKNAQHEGTLLVVTGPIFYSDERKSIGSNQVSIPDAYYKAIIDLYGAPKGIAFILPHEPSKQPLSHFTVTIDELETVINQDLFQAIPDLTETILEAKLDYEQWQP